MRFSFSPLLAEAAGSLFWFALFVGIDGLIVARKADLSYNFVI